MGVDDGPAAILARMRDDLTFRGLSANTREGYLTHARLFLEFCDRPIDALTTEDIRRFLHFLLTERGVTASTANVYSAALRFLFAVLEPAPELPANSSRQTPQDVAVCAQSDPGGRHSGAVCEP